MLLVPRHEVHDFRDAESRGQRHRRFLTTFSSQRSSGWDTLRKGISILGTTAFIGLTVYNLYVIGGWLNDWYAKKRRERYGLWKRYHVRDWNVVEHL
jgi:hypothetical protein